MRVFLDSNGEIRLDEGKKLGGRGAYLCPNAQCVEKALKKRALERALKTKNPPGETLQNELRAALK